MGLACSLEKEIKKSFFVNYWLVNDEIKKSTHFDYEWICYGCWLLKNGKDCNKLLL